MSYTDLVVAGDRLVAQRKDDVRTFTVEWVTNCDGWARAPGLPAYKIHRRGNNLNVFVGQYKVIGRI
jgi:hypothetical protein